MKGDSHLFSVVSGSSNSTVWRVKCGVEITETEKIDKDRKCKICRARNEYSAALILFFLGFVYQANVRGNIDRCEHVFSSQT